MGTLSIGNIYTDKLWVDENYIPPIVPDEPVKHVVSFDGAGGLVEVLSVEVEHGSCLEYLPSAYRNDYIFDGWFDQLDGGEQLTVWTQITEDRTYYAHWTAEGSDEPDEPDVEQFTLTFDGNGNGQIETREVLYGGGNDGHIGTFPVFTMVGYSFTGWYDSPEGGNVVDSSTVVDHDMTVYAQWQVNQYIVTFDANGGEGGWSRWMEFEEPIDEPTVTWNGHTFSGWSAIVPDFVPDHDLTFVAQWDVEICQVTFDDNGGEGGWSRLLPVGSSLTPPAVTMPGHMFVGWEPPVDSTVPEGGATYTAQWRVNQYEVTFDGNGGEGGWQRLMDYGSEISAPEVTRDGHTFAGWEPAVDQVVPDYDVAYAAQWEINQYEVVFDANGGEGGTIVRKDYGTEIVPPNVTWAGHTFVEWFPEVPGTMPLGGATYTAQWRTNSYQATFNANGGMGGTVQTLEYGAEVNAPAVTRDGYDFTGWSPAVPQTMPAENATYTAQWTPVEYSVTYDLNGHGSPNPNNIQTYTIETEEYAPEAPLDAGDQTFNGWTPELIPAGSTGDVTFTANWEPIDPTSRQYQVKFDANGGTGGWTRMMKYGLAISVPTVSREGHTFSGWSPAVDSTVPAHNVTYVAQWQVNQYTLTFDANGGTGGTSRLQNYGAAVAVPTVTMTGYTLYGWTPPVPATVPAANCTYTASWQVNSHVVTFNANGGTGGTRATRNYGTRITPPTVRRTGYTFVSWEPTPEQTVPDHDVTYTAKWQVNRYTMTFNANGGEGGTSMVKDYGSSLVAPTVTNSTYDFDHWQPSVPSTVPAEDKTFTAQWRVKQYTVTFDPNGGQGGWSKAMNYGSRLTAPVVTREGHTFANWLPAVPSTVPAENATYTAQWTKNKYQVKFDANGGTGGWTRTMDYQASISAPTVTRTGYTFAQWIPAVASTVPASNVTYAAQWNIVNYSITYNMNGHGASNPQNLRTYNIETGTYAPQPPENVEGWTFTGWTPASIPARSTGDFTFTANWEKLPEEVLVTFDANGGEGGWSQTMTSGSQLSAPTVTKVGHTFAGWNPTVPSTVPDHDATYVAQWQTNKYTVTFDANGGTGGRSSQMDYGTALSAPTVERTGYTFDGWNPSVDATVPARDVTYVAEWTANKYTVTFNADGGTGGTSEQLDYGSQLSAPQVAKTGYEFAGWNPAVPQTVPLNGGTYTAQWNVIEYAITYDMNGHGVENPNNLSKYTIETRGYTPLPPNEVEGLVFSGWTPTSIPAGSTGDVTFTANWGTPPLQDGYTRLWWTTPRDSGSEPYTDINIVGELKQAGLSVDGHTRTDIVAAEIGTNVTSIKTSTFKGCSKLQKITIPDTVTSIETAVFQDCTKLSTVTIPNGITEIKINLFKNCGSLRNITIPNSVTTIEHSVFSGCSSLTSVTIPDSVTSIGNSAFSGCSGLTSVTIPNSVTNIAYYMFKDCTNLMNVTIGNSVASIEGQAFLNCVNLTNIVFPNSLVSIGNSAFENCSGLTEVIIPNGVTDIDNYAFEKCSNLTDITIGNGVTRIGGRAFIHCTNLENVYITDLANWCNISLEDNESNPLCRATKLYLNGTQVSGQVEIPNGPTRICRLAFNNCNEITSIIIPDGVTSIGAAAFSGCNGLTSVIIPDTVTDIENDAFSGCSALAEITIPNSVISMGTGMLNGCNSLQRVEIPPNMQNIDKNIFNTCSNCTIFDFRKATSIPVLLHANAFANTPSNREIIVPDEFYDYWVVYGNWSSDENNIRASIVKASESSLGELSDDPFESSRRINLTAVKYTADSGLSNWADKITGEIKAHEDTYHTIQIPNVQQVEELIIGEDVTIVGRYAFHDCYKITKITIQGNLEKIETSAFRYCDKCTVFDFRKASTVPTLINVNAFYNTSSNKEIIVPDELYDEWIAAENWNNETYVKPYIVKASQSSLGPLT